MTCRPPAPRPPRLPSRLALALGASLALAGAPSPAPAQDMVAGIETPGRARFQICRNWLLFHSCNQYSRVEVPPRIRVGDTLYLEFGSNNKSMGFKVSDILFVASTGTCVVYEEPPEPGKEETSIDKLTITECRRAGP